MAIWGKTAFLGDYRGFTVWDISSPVKPRQLADVTCNGQQHDVSVWDGLLFLSVDRPITEPPCGPNTQTGVTGFEGILIYDVSDPAAPAFVSAVPTDCGSHTHTLIPDGDRVLLYVSSYPASFLGPTPFGTDCQRLTPTGEPTGHSKISVVEVPLADPAAAAVDVQENFDGRGPWSSYWYNGRIFVSDRGRGLDVKLLTGPARAGARHFPYLNAQTQEELIR